MGQEQDPLWKPYKIRLTPPPYPSPDRVTTMRMYSTLDKDGHMMFIHWAQKPHNLDEWSHELIHADSKEEQEQKQLLALRSRRRGSYSGTNMDAIPLCSYHGRSGKERWARLEVAK